MPEPTPTPADDAPRCTCGHERRDHSAPRQAADLPRKYKYWCHGCEFGCVYCPADDTQPAVSVHGARDLSPEAREGLDALIAVATAASECDFDHPHPDHPCGKRTPAPGPLREQYAAGGPGWYEVINPRNATTCVAFVHEDGSLYFPEGEQVLNQNEFEFAAARGNAHRLIRVADAMAVRDTELQQLREQLAEARTALRIAEGDRDAAEGHARRLLAQRQEMADERYAWQERGDRAETAIARVRELAGSWRLGHHEGDLGPGWDSAATALLAVLGNPDITHYEIGLDHAATTGRAALDQPQEQP